MAGGSRRVFISYARIDAQRIEALLEGMRQLHHDVWVDRELTGGQAWWDAVLAQIRDRDVVLVAVSPAAVDSQAVKRECEYGLAVGRPLLPVKVDRVQLDILPPFLAPLQVVDFCRPDVKSAFALAAAVAALPAPRPLPQPLPEPPPAPISYLSELKELSQATALSMDQQLALVARLKAALDRSSHRAAAEEVLRSLQDRNDLYLATAREIDSVLSTLNRHVPAGKPEAALDVRLPESSTRNLPESSTRNPPESSTGKWVVNQLRAEPGRLVLELIGHNRHVLECRRRPASIAVFLDTKPVAKPSRDGQSFEFRDGGELVEAWIADHGEYPDQWIDLRLGGEDVNSHRIP